MLIDLNRETIQRALRPFPLCTDSCSRTLLQNEQVLKEEVCIQATVSEALDIVSKGGFVHIKCKQQDVQTKVVLAAGINVISHRDDAANRLHTVRVSSLGNKQL